MMGLCLDFVLALSEAQTKDRWELNPGHGRSLYENLPP